MYVQAVLVVLNANVNYLLVGQQQATQQCAGVKCNCTHVKPIHAAITIAPSKGNIKVNNYEYQV